MENIAGLIDALGAKKTADGCRAMNELIAGSRASNSVYPYMGRFIEMLGSGNSYIRTRALLLISANAAWDESGLICEKLAVILSHITDEKPITARQFIQSLPELVSAKPELRQEVIKALREADVSAYADSMRPLVEKDIRRAVSELSETREQNTNI